MRVHPTTWCICALTLALGACGRQSPTLPDEAGGDEASEELELGVQWVTLADEPGDADFVQNEILDFPADYSHRITSDHYEGMTLIRITRSYDLTDTSDRGHEHVLRLSTSRDSEEFSTWDSLRSVQASTVGPSPVEYSVTFGLPAEASAQPERDNGILEIDPSRNEALRVTWEYPAKDDAVTTDFELSSSD